MSQNKIPDFTETELWTVGTTLKERYGKEIELQFADTGVMLGADVMAWVSRVVLVRQGRQLHYREIRRQTLPGLLLLLFIRNIISAPASTVTTSLATA